MEIAIIFLFTLSLHEGSSEKPGAAAKKGAQGSTL